MKYSLFRSLLLHIFCIWILVTLNQLLPYMYRVHVYGNYLWKSDHEPTTTLDYFLLSYQGNNAWHSFFLFLLYIPLVELNYWYIVKKRPVGKAIVSSLVIGAIAALSILFPWQTIAFTNDPFAFLYAFLSFSAYAFIYGIVRKYISERANRRALQLERAESELNALKAQLNPHFFFNSLNYVYGTALKEGAERTAAAISTLSDMMRYTVSATKENFVPLKDELVFIENYLALQRARIPEKETISLQTLVRGGADPHQIAPMLLLPFIENAFKYGISIDHPSSIKIRIEVSGNRLSMEVENGIIKEHTAVKGNNTAIHNTRKRLDLLYPEKHSLRCEADGSIYKVSFLLLLH